MQSIQNCELKSSMPISLEISILLDGQSKLCSNAKNQELWLPGTLSVLNSEALHMALQFARSINGKLAKQVLFMRKSDSSPNSARGYIVTQETSPLVTDGCVQLPENGQQISVVKAYLEEATADPDVIEITGLDWIAGMPVLKIISAPTICNVGEAVAYVDSLLQLLQQLKIIIPDAVTKQFVCDVKFANSTILGLRSVCDVEAVIAYEIERRADYMSSIAGSLVEFRRYDAMQKCTVSLDKNLFSNSESCYLVDPDLPPIILSA